MDKLIEELEMQLSLYKIKRYFHEEQNNKDLESYMFAFSNGLSRAIETIKKFKRENEMDYFDSARAKELESQNEILRYKVNELQSEIETLRKLLLLSQSPFRNEDLKESADEL